MTAAEIIALVVAWAAVSGMWLAVAGVLTMRSAYDRLHYVSFGSVVGPVLMAIAVAVRHSSAEAVIKAILIAVAFLMISPILTHATARAQQTREEAAETLAKGRHE